MANYNAYFGTGSDTPYYLDPYTGQRKRSTRQSVGWACKVIDALPNLDFLMSLGIVYTPCVMAGGTVPSTMAGVLANGLAESLSGLVINQTTREGSPFIMGGVFTIMDMSPTTFSYGSPEFDLLMAALADLCRYMKLPMCGTCGCTDSRVVDEQAGIEAALSIAMTALSGPNLNHDVGYIEYGSTASMEYLAICDDVIGMARRLVRGIEVNFDTLALDLLDQVGPGGHFLAEDHTMKYFKTETFYPTLINRQRYDSWKADGSKTLLQRANGKVRDIIENYEPDPLPAAIQAKVHEVVDRAERKIVKTR